MQMANNQKPFIKRAAALVLYGFVLTGVTSWGLGELMKGGFKIHEPWLTIAFLAPLSLVVAGIGLFIYGKTRKL